MIMRKGSLKGNTQKKAVAHNNKEIVSLPAHLKQMKTPKSIDVQVGDLFGQSAHTLFSAWSNNWSKIAS